MRAARQGVHTVPNKRSAIKAMATSARRRLRNRSTISAVKTHLRNAERQIGAGDPESARPLVILAQRALDKAAEKGIIHPNNAARHKARMMRKLNGIAPAAAAPTEEKAPARRRTTTTARATTGRTATKAATTRTRKTATTSRAQRAEAAEKKAAPTAATRRRTATAATATKPATSRTTARAAKKDDKKDE